MKEELTKYTCDCCGSSLLKDALKYAGGISLLNGWYMEIRHQATKRDFCSLDCLIAYYRVGEK